jgi:uncharacterized protein (DUF58 family)
VKEQPTATLKLNTRLLPIMIGLLLIMQLIFPYKGWLILLIGLSGVWLISFIWAQSLARNLYLTREMRFGWAHVGDRLEERFTITNFSFFAALWVEIVDHTTMPDYRVNRVTGVGGNSENRWQTQGICTRRGLFTLGPTTLKTGDPFSLYTVTLHSPEFATLTVTPPIVPLPALHIAPGGRAGEGRPRPNSFEQTITTAGMRSYTPGDSYHWIHWRTSARLGSLYVRLFDNTPSGDWWIFVDLDQEAQVGQGYTSTEEHSVILAASLADRGIRAGRAVGLVAHGQELVWLPPQSSDSQRHEILRALALATTGPRPLADLLTHTRPGFSQMANLIIITAAVENKTWLEALLPLLRQGAAATVLLLDPISFGGSGDPYPTQILLTNLGITHHLITADLLDQPEVRPGQEGQWDWRISPTGRAVPIKRPRDTTWKELTMSH